MKKGILAQIKEKYGAIRDEAQGSSVGEAYRAAREAARVMKVSNVRDRVWMQKRDACQQVCGLKPDENGCYDYDAIDMKNPIVEIEYFLCDPSNRAHTSQHLPMEKRRRYIESHLSPEAADLFWHPEKGAQYDHSGTPYNLDGWTPWHKLEFRFGDVWRTFGGGRIDNMAPPDGVQDAGDDQDGDDMKGGDRDGERKAQDGGERSGASRSAQGVQDEASPQEDREARC